VDFSFTEEQEAVAEAAASVFDGMVTPARVAEIERTDDRVDDELWAALARSNLLGLAVPEARGDRASASPRSASSSSSRAGPWPPSPVGHRRPRGPAPGPVREPRPERTGGCPVWWPATSA
jgi:alkylation response protein AidB-like acyl-CoA dehydrogenase